MSHVNHQQGSIVTLLLILMALLALTPVVRGSGMKDPAAMVRKKNIDSLAQAKEALLNYLLIGDPANMNWNTMRNDPNLKHARFPCPDMDGNGLINSADTALCGAVDISVLGLFPWGTLGTPQLSDGSGNCLWYAVSGRHKLHNPKAGVNGDENGSFAIYDAQFRLIALNVVAVLIAPGAALGGQSRGMGSCPAASAARQFLETVSDPNGSGAFIDHADLATGGKVAANFITLSPSDAPVRDGTMNDQIAWITAEEYALAATRHAAEMEKAAWTPVLEAFHAGTTDPDDNTKFIYPPPANAPGLVCGVRTQIVSGFLPATCTVQDWWEDWGWYMARFADCGTPSYWEKYRHWVDGYWVPWSGGGQTGTVWVDGYWYWDHVGLANERALLRCDRWDRLLAEGWVDNQPSLGTLPPITTALANDGWEKQTLYTIDGARLDGAIRPEPLILLRSRPSPSQSCSPLTITVGTVSGCLENPNSAAINGTRQFSTPNPRVSNDLIRVMQKAVQN